MPPEIKIPRVASQVRSGSVVDDFKRINSISKTQDGEQLRGIDAGLTIVQSLPVFREGTKAGGRPLTQTVLNNRRQHTHTEHTMHLLYCKRHAR